MSVIDPSVATDVHVLARESLAAATAAEATSRDERIAAWIHARFAAGDGGGLTALFADAPSPDVYRHLWRILSRLERDGTLAVEGSPVRLYALPVVVVAALQAQEDAPCTLSGVLGEPAALAALLMEHGALAGNRTLALAPALADANALEIGRLPEFVGATAVGAGGVDVVPAPIVVAGTTEAVHLRFLVGTALAAPGADLFREREAGKWAMPLAQRLSAMLAVPGTSVLAMARPPQSLAEALWSGRVAQREVAAQLFVGNALRELRARVGEPVTVISVHRGPDGTPAAAGPAEVRLSLSSPLEPRDAQGLRCPLWPLDRADDVAAMLAALLADCRVSDVRREPGVHPDRDPVTGGPLLFKPEGDAALRH